MRDDNGLLGGNWKYNKDVYFSVQTDMAQWRVIGGDMYMSHFQYKGDSIVLMLNDGRRGVCSNDGSVDTPILNASEVQPEVPMPSNFAYRVERVGHKELVLSYEGHQLILTRY